MFFENKTESEGQQGTMPVPQREMEPVRQPEIPVARQRSQPTQGTQASQIQHSVIGADMTITGELISEGDIVVDGRVDGDITCRTLVLGTSVPMVNATVNAVTVRIGGAFSGVVKAVEVMLTKDAKVSGEIQQQSLEIEKGAILEGTIRHLESPPDQASPAP